MNAKAWSVKRLAEEWDCSTRHIYDMIDTGRLKSFALGERSLRITDEEKRRCEQPSSATVEEQSASVGAEKQRALTTILQAVRAVAQN